MPSGSRKQDYDDEQYTKQLAHSRAWKKANRERVLKYNRDYNARRRSRNVPEPVRDLRLHH